MRSIAYILLFWIIVGCGNNELHLKSLDHLKLKEYDSFIQLYGKPKSELEYFANKENSRRENEWALKAVPDGFRKEIDKVKECQWELENIYVIAYFFLYNDKWIMYYGYEWGKDVMLD